MVEEKGSSALDALLSELLCCGKVQIDMYGGFYGEML